MDGFRSVALVGAALTLTVSAAAFLPQSAPRGTVRLERHAVADARGPFNALGASLFWLAWGYKFDRPRLEANLEMLSRANVDYVRALGDVGPDTWEDREIDPRWPDYLQVVAGATDLAYNKYGLRVQWTLFGGSTHLPTPEARRVLLDTFVQLAEERSAKLFAFEIANEYANNQFNEQGGLDEVRRLGRDLAQRTNVLVALSAPANGNEAACVLYGDAAVDFATVHYSRATGQGGPWQPVWQPWLWPAAFEEGRCARLPVAFNNEPIGPEASVNADDDPVRMAMAYVTTFISGNAAYVFHAGPGIRGGGKVDLDRGRSRNYADLARGDEILRALSRSRQSMPPGVANWERRDVRDARSPIRGLEAALDAGVLKRGLSATDGRQSLVALLGLRQTVRASLLQAAVVEVIAPETWEVLVTRRVAGGESFEIVPRGRPDGDGLFLRIQQ